MFRDHFDTRIWLERQLRELEAWRDDLIHTGQGQSSRLEQIELHRQWLEAQISRLSTV